MQRPLMPPFRRRAASVLDQPDEAFFQREAVRASGLGTGGRAFVLYCARSVQAFLTNNSMQMAAAIAFYSFFSLFPLSYLVLLAFDQFGGGTASQQEHLTRIISTFIPVSRDVVAQSINTASESRETLGPLALIGLIWASTAVFATLRKAINTAWNVWRPRRFLKERVMDLALTAGAGLLFLGLLVAMTLVRSFNGDHSAPPPTDLFSGPAWLSASSFAITFLAFTLLYRYLPNRAVRYRDVLFGALLAAVAFEVAKAAFFVYVQGHSGVSLIYGPVTSVAILLGWLYTSAAIVLIGALTASIYARLIELRIVSHLDVWTLGLAPAMRRLRHRAGARPEGRRQAHRPPLPGAETLEERGWR